MKKDIAMAILMHFAMFLSMCIILLIPVVLSLGMLAAGNALAYFLSGEPFILFTDKGACYVAGSMLGGFFGLLIGRKLIMDYSKEQQPTVDNDDDAETKNKGMIV